MKLKYLAIGDFFMDGPELPEGSAWPHLLVEELRRENYDIADPVLSVNRDETVAQILYALRDSKLPSDFDLVTVQAGAWDIATHTPLALYSIAVADLLAEAIRLGAGDGSRVVVVTPPLFGDVNDESYLEHFTEMIRQQFLAVMEQGDPHIIDLVESSLDLLFGEDPNRTELGFPNAVVHRAWALDVARPVRHIFGPPERPGPRLLHPESQGIREPEQD